MKCGADQRHSGAGQHPPRRLGQGGKALAEKVLPSGHWAEEEKKRPPRPNAEGDGGAWLYGLGGGMGTLIAYPLS